jgi:hypothetical protein
MMHSPLPRLVLLCLALAPGVVADARANPAGVEFFEKKIRPVLVEQCYPCHSAQAKANKKLRGGLYLDPRKGNSLNRPTV